MPCLEALGSSLPFRGSFGAYRKICSTPAKWPASNGRYLSAILMSMRPSNTDSQSPTDAAARLAEIIATKKFIPFHVDLPDKEYVHIKGSIYGAIETNELFVKLTNGKTTFVESVESPLLAPAMADRIFGMDVSDSNVAFALANEMWEKHKDALIGTSDGSQ